MPSSTVEQYIKIIYLQAERSRRSLVQMKELAAEMGVTPGTATSMVKHLAERGLILYVPRKGVELTDAGRSLALTMVRRHRLIETFLEQVLGYDWSEVHDDAERLEHAVSEQFVDRIDAYLGNPEFDPHGDPIPTADGAIERHETCPLSRCQPGQRVEIRRIGNTDSSVLSLMKEYQVMPGEVFTLVDSSAAGGTVSLQHDSSAAVRTIGLDLGSRIQVAVLAD
ncbi:metal-dependent transcriptional regulator [Spirochaeta africana]|uniref:Transcriptional regulator MntR n=1 Tax=Spirochaeta africana (strain ATCC 700263 / DSM 8902 / Z-7692) TaxID=889378 RepID=H9UGH8_SPIAZ|nr:metal-dependent transcriptional regulator [Spirochaeta africana]AFG36621.1 Mn-dependent transcriptional regulator [Spirochaeta africana DSM 8902]